MRQLDPTEFDMSSKRKQRNGYDWSSYFDGKINLLIYGDDYHCQSATLIQQLYTNARKMGKVITVRKYTKEVDGNTVHGVVVQCTGDANRPIIGTGEHKPIETGAVNPEPVQPVIPPVDDPSFSLVEQPAQVVNDAAVDSGSKKNKNSKARK